MTTFAVAAPPPIAPSQRPATPTSQNTTQESRHVSPETVSNAPNAFLARLDELAKENLEGPQVGGAIEQGRSAPEIASRYGIRQGSDAYKTLESRVEARRRGT